MARGQQELFRPEPDLPAGFRYEPELIAAAEESELVGHIEGLPFAPFEFHGFTGKRRVVSFGWRYDFNGGGLEKAHDMPGFLTRLRPAVGRFSGIDPSTFQHVMVTEYAPGAAIGWHKDRSVFGDVVGISLLAPCTFRLRKKGVSGWARRSLIAEPRSAYLLHGPSRTDWENSIPAVEQLRYSITFRTLKAERQ